MHKTMEQAAPDGQAAYWKSPGHSRSRASTDRRWPCQPYELTGMSAR